MTRKNLRVASALTLFLVVAGVAVAQTPRRLALVIGNSGYTREPVPTAGEDALLMKSSLEGIGFEVDYYENVDRQAFLQAIQQFEATLRCSTSPGTVLMLMETTISSRSARAFSRIPMRPSRQYHSIG